MRKQLRFLLLLWVFGYTLFFSCGTLVAANPYTNYSSDDLGSTDVITDSSENLRERTGDNYFYPSLIADFGAMGALWRYSPTSGWSQLSTASSNLMVGAVGGLVANFPGHGLYQYDGTTWTQLTPNDTVQALFGDGVLFADYGTLGLWQYNGSWAQIASADANLLKSYGGNLVANFPGLGLYMYDGETWTQLTPNDTVQALIAGPGTFTTNYVLYADYGALGLWRYDGEWHNVSYANCNKMDYFRGHLVANFPGYGLYRYNGWIWAQLTLNDTVEALIVVEGFLYADYGTLGLWKYDGSWAQITPADANVLGWLWSDPQSNLVANFPGNGGLYQYNGSSWAPLTSNSGITNMVNVYFY
jgi:hypothetical protein